MGLALSRHLLRRSLALQGAPGKAVLATVIARPPTGDTERGESKESPLFEEWAARLSRPSVELLVQADHVALEEDGELIASGSLRG
jgi:hypothetical protein